MSAVTVLVVDDEPVVLKIVTEMLRHEGYEVFPAAGPRQALEFARKNPTIDLVVSDIDMPEMQGTELVCEVARISPQSARVLMTGGVVHPGQVPEHVWVLSKPFSAIELYTAAGAALEHSAKFGDELARRVKCLPSRDVRVGNYDPN